MQKLKRHRIALLLIPAILLVKIIGRYPEFVETYYSNGIYIYISKFMRYSFGWLPFSFGDLVYILGIVYIIRWLVINRKRIIKDTLHWFLDIISFGTIIYVAFNLIWGLNYYRQPLHENLNLEADYTTETLISVTKKLIKKSNTLHNELIENDSLMVVFPYTKNNILTKVPKGYEALKKTFNHLEYQPKSIKKSILSLPLTYMGFSGYLNPLTLEAQVNILIPAYKLPTTASHEVAHQLGYAAENEANFIGCLAAINHEDSYFKYSGYTFGLRHCLHELYKRDQDEYYKLVETINKGILKNYQEVREFWNSYQNPSEVIFKKSYNTYLKANSQDKGMESYSYVVALLVNYFNENTL